MTVSALFFMGSIAIVLLGTFSGFMAHTVPLRLPGASTALAIARVQYILSGLAIFALGAVAYLPAVNRPARHELLAKLGFWLMFLGFNLAFFPSTLRRSQALLTDPMRLLSPAVGSEVTLGALMFVSGAALCIWCYALVARAMRT